MKRKVRVAIFASGTGSNAKAIISYTSRNKSSFEVGAILSNKRNAGVLTFARSSNIDSLSFDRSRFYDNEEILEYLFDKDIDMIVLAGFLWLIPTYLLDAFPDRIINIHPSILPKYGGKGMYGLHIHKAVKENLEKKSGMTIHFVNQRYDQGNMILQAQSLLHPNDTPEQIGQRILKMEHHFYPLVVEGIAGKLRNHEDVDP